MGKYIHIDKDELYNLYITQNLTRIEVAERLGVRDELIKAKLRKYKIKKSPELHQANIERMCLQKFGVKNGGWTKESIEKIKKHNLEVYGVEWYMNSDDFKEKTQKTLKEKYGENIINVFQADEVKEKIKCTNIKRYGTEHNMQNKEIYEKANNTRLEKYGKKCYCQTKEYLEKTKQTNLKRYGVEYSSQNKEIINKVIETKRKRGTFNTSKAEKEILELLRAKFKDVKYQYKSEKYPFACDFYIPELDLYIEYQGFWSHGTKLGPFNPDNPEHLKVLEKYKDKAKDHLIYRNAIEVWTIRDPLKRQTAKENSLNWLEFFNMNDFISWYTTKF